MPFTPAYIFSVLLGVWVLSLVGCIALAIFCYRLLIDRGKLLLRLEQATAQPPVLHIGGLQAGAYLSDVSLPLASPEPHDEPPSEVTISHLLSSHADSQVLMFLDSACLYSRALARELSASLPQPEHPGLIAIIGGDPPGSPDFPLFPGTLLHDPQRQAAPIYGVAFTPAGYLVAPTRHTVSSLMVGPVALLRAAQGADSQDSPRTPLPVTPIPHDGSRHLPPLTAADAAPELHLTGATGESWSLGDHRGLPLTLLFIAPDCPPCRATLALLAASPCPGLIVISQGTLEDPLNATAAALPGVTLLLQEQREAAHAFRLLDTPALYEVSADGAISAGPIVGLQQITHYLEGGICRHAPPGTSAARSGLPDHTRRSRQEA